MSSIIGGDKPKFISGDKPKFIQTLKDIEKLTPQKKKQLEKKHFDLDKFITILQSIKIDIVNFVKVSFGGRTVRLTDAHKYFRQIDLKLLDLEDKLGGFQTKDPMLRGCVKSITIQMAKTREDIRIIKQEIEVAQDEILKSRKNKNSQPQETISHDRVKLLAKEAKMMQMLLNKAATALLNNEVSIEHVIVDFYRTNLEKQYQGVSEIDIKAKIEDLDKKLENSNELDIIIEFDSNLKKEIIEKKFNNIKNSIKDADEKTIKDIDIHKNTILDNFKNGKIEFQEAVEKINQFLAKIDATEKLISDFFKDKKNDWIPKTISDAIITDFNTIKSNLLSAFLKGQDFKVPLEDFVDKHGQNNIMRLVKDHIDFHINIKLKDFTKSLEGLKLPNETEESLKKEFDNLTSPLMGLDDESLNKPKNQNEVRDLFAILEGDVTLHIISGELTSKKQRIEKLIEDKVSEFHVLIEDKTTREEVLDKINTFKKVEIELQILNASSSREAINILKNLEQHEKLINYFDYLVEIQTPKIQELINERREGIELGKLIETESSKLINEINAMHDKILAKSQLEPGDAVVINEITRIRTDFLLNKKYFEDGKKLFMPEKLEDLRKLSSLIKTYESGFNEALKLAEPIKKMQDQLTELSDFAKKHKFKSTEEKIKILENNLIGIRNTEGMKQLQKDLDAIQIQVKNLVKEEYKKVYEEHINIAKEVIAKHKSMLETQKLANSKMKSEFAKIKLILSLEKSRDEFLEKIDKSNIKVIDSLNVNMISQTISKQINAHFDQYKLELKARVDDLIAKGYEKCKEMAEKVVTHNDDQVEYRNSFVLKVADQIKEEQQKLAKDIDKAIISADYDEITNKLGNLHNEYITNIKKQLIAALKELE